MLNTLRMKSFAVVDECELNFQNGLTVLTGETGAGKSILIDALSLLLGGRTRVDVIRAGCDEAVVEGVFEINETLRSRLDELGISSAEHELLVRRSFAVSGKNRIHVNGDLVTVGVLGRLMRGQIDLAGQHEHMALFDVSQHVKMVDALSSTKQIRAHFDEAYSQLQQVKTKLSSLGGDETQLATQIEFLNFQIGEIDRVGPSEGEDVFLDSERKRLGAEEKQRKNLEAVDALLVGAECQVSKLVDRILAHLVDAEKSSPELKMVRERIEVIKVEVGDISHEISKKLSHLEGDTKALDDIESRLDVLRKLTRKHAAPLEAVIAKRSQLAQERDALLSRGETRALLLKQQETYFIEATNLAEKVSKERAKNAKHLVQQVEKSLAQLAMPKAQFEVSCTRGTLTAIGVDEIEFLFSANPGESVKPLSKVASGGEASRVMLAIKTVLSSVDESRCTVLDEADAGLGGSVADEVGKMLRNLSRARQVLCITHVPQVAAYADAHLHIEKKMSAGRTKSIVSVLNQQSRAGELARMISGSEVTVEAVSAAEALLRGAAEPGVLVSRRTKRNPVQLGARKGRLAPD
jgi:DNA repair protein RecN (Recombination protein N)